ncbi:hypothetical protein FXF51_20430 [Nonomuraea sp. PA05]|uniref:hypothetical protein n=1 Tax=Nonomuraea sp. PA05 TaxID=2604466 RepID=UPI0011D73045|nr:hypothetical protein [Nonomuraea sp. PA05]TYB64821.1 hypothetical protein FXF51_20430 [Nonomuraea sp. PA05]
MITEPPGLPFLTAVAATVSVILLWASYPIWYFELILLAFVVGGLLALYWVIRIALASRKVDVHERSGRWLSPVFIAGGVLLALITDAPFHIRFTLSQPSLDLYAAALIADPERERPCQWVGLYFTCGGGPYMDLDTGELIPGSAQFSVHDPFLHDNKGFLWLPSAEPDETADDRYRHLTRDWYGHSGWDHW